MGQAERTVAAGETMDLNQISIFAQVVEAQSFTAAGKTLRMPKSSVSRAVAKLEAELGVVLLQRTTRSLTLTDAGQRYLARAREALQLLNEARDEARENDAEPRGTVRLTVAPDPSGRTMLEPLSRFLRLHPGIHVELLVSARRVDLVEEGVDLAVRAGKADDSSLVGKRVGGVADWLVATPGYLAERGTPRKLSDLARHDCVLFRGARGTERWTLTGKNGEESVVVRGPVNVDDMPFVHNFALEGLGIALLPELLVEPRIVAGELVRVLPQYRRLGSSLYIVHPATRRLPRRVALLRDFLFDALRAELTRCSRVSGATGR
jgi:DNA-binding transcriptional LysR family regulator